ncbi:MAG: sensor histidine kinase [Acidimicrobiales bacterium]
MPIRLRLAVAFALAAALVVAASGWLLLHLLIHELNTSVDTTLSQRAPVLARVLSYPPPGRGDGISGTHVSFGFPAHPPEREASPRERFVGHFGPPIGQIIGNSGRVTASLPASGSSPILPRSDLALARRQVIHLNTVLPGSKGPARLLAEPDPFSRGAVLVVGASTGGTTDLEHRLAIGLLLIVLPVAVTAGAGAWLLAGAALQPVERLRREAASISAHDTDARLKVPASSDEIASLARTMDELLARMQMALRRQKAFVSDASHELRSPLATLEAELELASREGRSPAEMSAAIGIALGEAERLRELTENLLVLARHDEHGLPLRMEPVALADVAGAAAMAAANLQPGSAPVLVGIPAGMVAVVDPLRMRQVFDNLLSNALRFSPGDSPVVVRGHGGGGAPFIVEVEDSGPGFPPAFLPMAFERFSRPDLARARQDGGAGLGLAIVKVIVEAHGGRVEAANLVPNGARVKMTFPAPIA